VNSFHLYKYKCTWLEYFSPYLLSGIFVVARIQETSQKLSAHTYTRYDIQGRARKEKEKWNNFLSLYLHPFRTSYEKDEWKKFWKGERYEYDKVGCMFS